MAIYSRDTRIKGGLVQIEPGKSVVVWIRSGPTVGEWIANGDQPIPVNVVAGANVDGPEQHWVITMKAQLLSPATHNASLYAVRPHVMIDCELKVLGYDYPDESKK